MASQRLRSSIHSTVSIALNSKASWRPRKSSAVTPVLLKIDGSHKICPMKYLSSFITVLILHNSPLLPKKMILFIISCSQVWTVAFQLFILVFQATILLPRSSCKSVWDQYYCCVLYSTPLFPRLLVFKTTILLEASAPSESAFASLSISVSESVSTSESG